MIRKQFPDTDPQDDDDQQLVVFILPAFVQSLGFSCASDWTEERTTHECGCPRCLKKLGLSLCYHQEDWNETGDMQSHWRKRVVSMKTASYASHLLVSGYE